MFNNPLSIHEEHSLAYCSRSFSVIQRECKAPRLCWLLVESSKLERPRSVAGRIGRLGNLVVRALKITSNPIPPFPNVRAVSPYNVTA